MRLDLFLQQSLKNFLVKKSAESSKYLKSSEKFEKSENKISNSKIRRLIIAHKVFVDEKNIAFPSFVLKKNDCVKVLFDKDKFYFEKPTNDLDFTLDEKNVLFEDDVILVVNKPAFLPTEKTFVEGRKNLHDCAVEYLWKKNPQLRNPPYVGIMHRLDLETSGTVLFTKSRSVNKAFHEMFENREIKKIYFALCTLKNPRKNKSQKLPAKIGESFFVENYLSRISLKSDACKMGIVSQNAGGLLAKTRFKIVKKFSLADFTDFEDFTDFVRGKKFFSELGNFCSQDEKFESKSEKSCSKSTKIDSEREYFLVECELFTGRTHQIRVHLSSLGLPILGDELYGGDKNLLEKSGRIMLHAESLSFVHPLTKEKLTVRAPYWL